MNVKDLKEVIKDMPDDILVEVVGKMNYEITFRTAPVEENATTAVETVEDDSLE
jgi:hypothetical protein